jgi:hypothetical protein
MEDRMEHGHAPRGLSLLGCLALAGAALADDATIEAAVAVVRELGTVNGQALACGHSSTVAWSKVLMMNHAPKTRRFGEAFEEGTQAAFLAHSREPATCPDATALANRLQQVSERLRAALPPAAPASR